MRAFICVLMVVAGFALPARADAVGDVLQGAGIDPTASALLVVRVQDGATWMSGDERIEQRFVPASTSKIPHTLIALETGAVEGPDTVFQWDGVKRFIPTWNQDQTLRSAFQNSVVWVYQYIVGGLGSAVMSDWLETFDYGNADVGKAEDLTTYWLRGPLAISAREQVAFLERYVKRDLPLSPHTYALSRKVMESGRSEGFVDGSGWVLYGKTGWYSPEDDATDIGWYVGWLDVTGAEPATYLFAFNMDMANTDLDDPENDLPKRTEAVRAVLEGIGALKP